MNYHWTLASALYQVLNGGPTHRTLSAINWLRYESTYNPEHVAGALFDALVETRGFLNLGDVLEPLPDETETVDEWVSPIPDPQGRASEITDL